MRTPVSTLRVVSNNRMTTVGDKSTHKSSNVLFDGKNWVYTIFKQAKHKIKKIYTINEKVAEMLPNVYFR